MNANFTCHRHLLRLADAARWAREQGAKYLMIWEEDFTMGSETQTPQETGGWL